MKKYVGGRSNLIAGGCSGTAAALDPVRGMRTILGTLCNPHTGWLLMRSLETLKLRMTASAEPHSVAPFLEGHPPVASSGISASCPRWSTRSGAVRTPVPERGLDLLVRDQGRRGRSLRRPGTGSKCSSSRSRWGGTESLASHPASMTSSNIAPEEQVRLGGATPALIRLSVGIENPGDLIADLAQALE